MQKFSFVLSIYIIIVIITNKTKLFYKIQADKIWIWHSDGADNECDDCAELDSQVFFDESDVPACPLHPNCECWVEEQDLDANGNPVKSTKYAGTLDDGKNIGGNKMDKVLTQDLKNKIAGFEGIKPSPYTDSKGILTIGVGNNVSNQKNFVALELTNTTTHEKLTTDEKTALYDKITSEIQSNTFNEKNYTNIQMPIGQMYDKFDSQLNQSVNELEKKFPEFDTLPVPAQQALIDMQFNMGTPTFSESTWPKLFDAVSEQDWTTAAKESNRKDVQPSRNNWTRQQFMLL